MKIYWTISELQYFFIDIPTKILKNGVILVPFQFSGPTYKSSLISLKKSYFAGTKIEYEYWKTEYKNTSPPHKKKKKKKAVLFLYYCMHHDGMDFRNRYLKLVSVIFDYF